MYKLSKDSSSLEYFIRKYGEVLGKEKYNIKNMKASIIFNELKKTYPYEIAILKYKDYKENKKAEEYKEIVSKVTNRWFKNPNKNPVSKSSILFFDALKYQLKCDMMYGKKHQELKLFDEMNNKIYYYDCYIPKFNLILEYHGSAYHYHESFGDDWTHIHGIDKNTVIRHQRQKGDYARYNGYSILEVWDFEVSSKNKIYNKIKEILNVCDKAMV